MNGLTVGRMVHYVAYGTPGGEYAAGAHRAAIIAELVNYGIAEFEKSPEVTLLVINPTGIHFHTARFDDQEKKPGTWHWIEQA